MTHHLSQTTFQTKRNVMHSRSIVQTTIKTQPFEELHDTFYVQKQSQKNSFEKLFLLGNESSPIDITDENL